MVTPFLIWTGATAMSSRFCRVPTRSEMLLTRFLNLRSPTWFSASTLGHVGPRQSAPGRPRRIQRDLDLSRVAGRRLDVPRPPHARGRRRRTARSRSGRGRAGPGRADERRRRPASPLDGQLRARGRVVANLRTRFCTCWSTRTMSLAGSTWRSAAPRGLIDRTRRIPGLSITTLFDGRIRSASSTRRQAHCGIVTILGTAAADGCCLAERGPTPATTTRPR